MPQESDLTPELLELMKARDARIQAISDGIDVDVEIRNCKSLFMVRQALTEDAQKAMKELAFVNPGNTQAIMGLQARVYSIVYLDGILANVQMNGRLAEQNLMEMDR